MMQIIDYVSAVCYKIIIFDKIFYESDLKSHVLKSHETIAVFVYFLSAHYLKYEKIAER